MGKNNGWKKIPKDSYGFFDEDSKLYEKLPIVIAEIKDDAIYLHYIDDDNWYDTIADLSRERFKYYIEVEPLEL